MSFSASETHRDLWSLLTALGILPVGVYCAGMLFNWVFREKRAGRLLVDINRPRIGWQTWIWIVFIGVSIVVVVTGPDKHLIFSNTVSLFLWGTVWLAGRPLEIRERGLLSAGRIIGWGRVKNWHWESSGGVPQHQWSGRVEQANAILRIELVRPLFFRHSVRLAVRSEFLDDVSRAMDEHVPAKLELV